jgi:hypothetical protein
LASLTVCDNGSPPLCTSDVAAVTIQTEVGAQIILKNNGTVVGAGTSGGTQEFGIEEVLIPYTDLVQSSLKLTTTYPHAGIVSECIPDSRSFVFGDMDTDGVADFDMKISNKCIKKLFKHTPNNAQAEIVISGLFSSAGATTPLRAVRTVTIAVGVGPVMAAMFAYPNPFNPETSISYTVAGNAAVTIRIFAIDGRLVRTLKSGENTSSGTHEVRWNGTDERGGPMPSGIYFVKTTQKTGAGEQTSVLKLALTK